MKKARIIIAVLLVAITGVFVYLAIKQMGEEKNAKRPAGNRQIDAFVVHPSTLSDEISVSGSLLAFEEVELRNEVAGRVVQVNLPEGKFVKKGTLLVKLYDDDLQANLQKLQAQLALQEQLNERQEELLRVNGITQNEYDQSVLQLNTIKADIEIQKSQIKRTEVLAPFDGVIGLRYISIGANILPSTLLATIRTDNHLKLDFFVPEKYSAEIKSGQQINFTLFDGENMHKARVIASEQSIDNNTRNLKVRADVLDRDRDLIPGAFATVHLKLSENKEALLIPTQAIIPEEQIKRVIVARDGKAHFTEVKTGVRKASRIEVVEGISAGDTIITTGILFLREGMQLNYASVANSANKEKEQKQEAAK